MTAATDILSRAAAADIHVTVDGGRLILDAPADLPADLVAALREHKAAIIRLLTTVEPGPAPRQSTPPVPAPSILRTPAASSPVETWRAGVARLRPAFPIGARTQQEWDVFLADCRAFLASEWAGRAAALGWDSRALFGCHRDRPHVCNWWGALWFLRGGTILAMTDTTMSLQTIRGVRQSLRRMEHPYDFIVPVWDVRA